ncbi:hypothetical protein [Actinomycetospora cinnamomea]|uniref:Uncharacterized protein n=1 Tax=Actinomycetospora cinnamomea TaxID=663609 RepID=A0A2U1EZM9_9PSEU|nr:hypothetical protein [Actinomycetospora cinnamomea]PVZ05376.1 hypothetical protein C8D89_11581 [Actinomycetospora cinnamomea]
MDIGPVRRRLTAEPISSPVPGEEPAMPEPAAEVDHRTADPVTATDR